MLKTSRTCALAAMLLVPLGAAAENHASSGSAAQPPAGAQQMLDRLGTLQKDDSPSTRAFEEANEKMHHGMMIEFSGDADLDFVRSMIPHHQGAVDMARILLKHGKDSETRKLAESIIASQEAEIAMMKAWLEKNGSPVVEGGTMPGMGH